MAFAPLDVWARILFTPPAWVPPRYWLRLAFALFTSTLGTVGSLPERLILGIILRIGARRSGTRLNHKPGIVVILGYFRSGTTHLHYLLSCDPHFRTPAWSETLAPQGFRFSWAFLRLFMIPWISSKRPQDDMAIGPSWPAEDDFALNNWAAASSLPWRFVVPRHHDHYSRFHSLEGLTRRELARWRFHQYAFCWKLSRMAGRRVILLKSPSHIARVGALLDLFGPENVKFIHISRDPEAVIKSNVAMFGRMSVFGIQDPAPPEEARPLIGAEYIHSEEYYLRDLPAIPRGHITELRYEDLIADPIGQIKRIYCDLGLTYSPEFEDHALTYLNSVRDYRAANSRSRSEESRENAQGSKKSPVATASSDPTSAALRQIASRFRHDHPPIRSVPLPPAPRGDPQLREHRGLLVAIATALITAALWLTQGYFLHDRHNWLVWPVGAAIGILTLRAARVGTNRLGLIAALLTIIVFAGIAVPMSFLEDYIHRPYYHRDGHLIPMREWEWYHILKQSRVGLLAQHNLFWAFMGAGTAYRFASRKHVHPPGAT
jgi:hypothetical protein